MIKIHYIRLHLPAGLEGRANNIANMVAESLVSAKVTKTTKAERLFVEGVTASHNMADQQIVNAISTAIIKNIEEAA